MIAHFTCAKILEIPELELTQDESERLAEATRKVAKHYAMAMDPKKIAVVELLFVAGGIYGPRVIGYAKRTGTPKRVNLQSTPQPAQTAQPPGPGLAGPGPGSSGANGIPQPPPPVVRGGATVPSEVWDETVQDGSFI